MKKGFITWFLNKNPIIIFIITVAPISMFVLRTCWFNAPQYPSLDFYGLICSIMLGFATPFVLIGIYILIVMLIDELAKAYNEYEVKE